MDTEIQMYLPDNIANAEIRIISIQGKTIGTIPVNDRGYTAVTINGNTLMAGTYTYVLITDGRVCYKKMMLTN